MKVTNLEQVFLNSGRKFVSSIEVWILKISWECQEKIDIAMHKKFMWDII